MRLIEYQERARQTAQYPGAGTALGLFYVLLKLNGEAGEAAEHIGKAIRDDGFGVTTQTLLTPERRNLVLKELGDVLWYIANAAYELDTDLNHIAELNLHKLKSRQERGQIQGSGDDR